MAMMPRRITVVRHGESESNVASRAFWKGEKVPNEEALMACHTSERRLTKRGVTQARVAGAWLRSLYSFESPPGVFYVSSYVRAMETAANLGLSGAWRQDMRIMERNWGNMDQLTYEERSRRFKEAVAKREEWAFFWRPGDGETLQDVFVRVKDLLATLHREHSDKHVVLVTHGETMWVLRMLLEYWSPHRLKEEMLRDDSQTHIHNCRIIEYVRDEDERHLSRVRFIDAENPHDPTRNRDWEPIVRPILSDNELLDYVNQYPHYLTEFTGN
jgi:broad specificity phosphatase PhoE